MYVRKIKLEKINKEKKMAEPYLKMWKNKEITNGELKIRIGKEILIKMADNTEIETTYV